MNSRIKIFASTRASAGKTSLIAGLMSVHGNKSAYIKPFGDRLIYKRKRNWDYDANVLIDIFGIKEEPENITLGFDHSKLRYIYDEGNIESTLSAMTEAAGREKDYIFLETGKNMSYGASIHLDPLSICKTLKGELILIATGTNDEITDDILSFKEFIDLNDVHLKGVIINKVKENDEFEDLYRKEIEKTGINILGVIPFNNLLSSYTVGFITDKLYAKIIAGEDGLNNRVNNIFVGAMSTDESVRNPLFTSEKKLLITSGDREDTIMAGLETDTAGIILSNNIYPSQNILQKASAKNVPLLLVTMDTYQVAMHINKVEALITNDKERLSVLYNMLEKYVKLENIL